MNKLSLALGVGPYEHVRDLASGEVPLEGIDLTASVHHDVEEVLSRTHSHCEWHVAEMGLGGYSSRLSRGQQPYVAIPVFTSRVFRHSCIYVRRDAGIRTPSDLNGRRIGLPEWGMAAAVWARGMLMDEYGFDPRTAHWVQGGVNLAGRPDRGKPAGLDVSYESRQDRSLCDLMADGELDVLFSAHLPDIAARADSPVDPLFPDLEAAESGYWARTGILPIMHVMGIRSDVYEANRWVAQEMYRGFLEAKERCIARLRDTAVSHFPVPLMLHAAQRIGGRDFWPYGVEPNRKTLDTFLRYVHEQGITARRVAVDELFAPEVASAMRD